MNKCTIRYYGYSVNPHGIDSLLKSIVFNQPVTIHVVDPLTNISFLPYEDLAAATDKESIFVIIHTGEGHAYREFRQIIDRLITECGIIAKNIVINTAALRDSDDSPCNLIGSISPIAGQATGMADISYTSNYDFIRNPKQHFICLNRLPRWERRLVVETIMDRNLHKFGRMSYATADPKEMSLVDARRQFKLEYRHLIPMIIDKPLVSFEDGYLLNNDLIKNALFNVVTESAYEHKDIANNPYAKSIIAQHAPGVTEKTFKAFILGQVPIMVAPRGTVAELRALGFDMFDDVIDHSYDNEADPELRVGLIIDQLERVCKMYSVEDLQTLKEQLIPRMGQNVKVLAQWAHNIVPTTRRWVEFFKERGVAG